MGDIEPDKNLKTGKRPLAVALTHDPLRPELPSLSASGRGVLAEQIVALAFEHGVRVREDSTLAEILATLDLDTPIPSEAIIAVGEVLARLYEINTELAAGALLAGQPLSALEKERAKHEP